MRYLILVFAHYGIKGFISFIFPMYFTQKVGFPDQITFRETGRFYYKGFWWKNPQRGCGVDDCGMAVKLV